MPKYDYRCNECGEVGVYEHGMNERPRFCNNDGCYAPGENLERVFTSAPNINASGQSREFLSEGTLVYLANGESIEVGVSREVREDLPGGENQIFMANFVDKKSGKEIQGYRIESRK